MAAQLPASARRVRSKYGSVKTQVAGITFDSKAEAARFVELKQLEAIGDIDRLRLQVKYVLLPAKRNADGYLERESAYIADFVYLDREGNEVVEDMKSPATRTPEYVIKRKLMLSVHGITVREVGVKKRKAKA